MAAVERHLVLIVLLDVVELLGEGLRWAVHETEEKEDDADDCLEETTSGSENCLEVQD